MDPFDKTHEILSIHKNSMMLDMREYMNKLRKSSLNSGMSEHEFWIVFSFVLHLHAVYSTYKMCQHPGQVPKILANSQELHMAYLAVFGDATFRNLSLEEILVAAGEK
jgi:hypothetical protein